MQRINYSIPNELIIFNIQAILKSIDQLLYNLYLNIYNYTQYSMRRVIILIKVHLLIIFKRFKKTKKKKNISKYPHEQLMVFISSLIKRNIKIHIMNNQENILMAYRMFE